MRSASRRPSGSTRASPPSPSRSPPASYPRRSNARSRRSSATGAGAHSSAPRHGPQQRRLLGLGSGDRSGAFRGGSGSLERTAQQEKNQPRSRQSALPSLVPNHVAARRSLHGKEGVNGSSPLEGFRKFLLFSSFFVASETVASLGVHRTSTDFWDRFLRG